MFEKMIGLGMMCALVACATDPRLPSDEADARGQPAATEQDAGSAERLMPSVDSKPCTRSADCAALSAEHVCENGTCRESLVAVVPGALPYARGGRRLRAQHYVVDGAEKFLGLYDSQLDLACEFAPDVSGAGFHCVPKTVREVIYLDSACTEPALPIDDWGATLLPGAWLSALTTRPAPLCRGEPPAVRTSYQVGERFFEGGRNSLGRPLPTVYAKNGTTCSETQLQVGLVPPNVHRLLPVDPALLVAGTLSTLDVGGGMSLQRVVAEDDTQVTLAVLGLGGQPCKLLPGGGCVPEPLFSGSGGFFLDGLCEQVAFFAASLETCGRMPHGVRVDGNTAHVFELVQTRSAFFKATNPASCTAFVAEMDVFQAGAEITDTFPTAAVLQTGTGTLHLSRFAGSHGASSSAFVALDPGGEFLDAQGHACLVAEATDGSLRCLPERSYVNEAEYWRDDTCGERLYVAADPAVDLSELRVVRRRGDAIEALFSLIPHEGVVYEVVETHCVRAGVAPIPLLARDNELPLTTLARVASAEL